MPLTHKQEKPRNKPDQMLHSTHAKQLGVDEYILKMKSQVVL